MAESDEQKPKIIIDSDWKEQAQKEREKLAEQEAQAEQSAQGAAGGQGQQGELPPPNMQGLVSMLASQAIMYMGGVADRESGRAVFDPEVSAYMIDLLGVLEEKTRGNLTEEESTELQQLLNELRSRYVELLKMVAQQQAQGAAPGTPGTPGTPGSPGSAPPGAGPAPGPAPGPGMGPTPGPGMGG